MNGPSLAPALKDRKVWLFALVSVVSAAVGFKLVPDRLALGIVNNTGYWCVLAAFVLFGRALWLAYRGDLAAIRKAGPGAFDWASLGVIGLGGMVLIVHESPGFKIVMDEVMLAGTSMSMHFSRTVLTPLRGSDIQGAFVIVEGMMDKRQLFFPFLVSILHDLIGYRPSNAFVLNGILAFIFLALVNQAGRRLAGRTAGWLGVALFAGLPLLAQNATGGGFELLNILMILATLLLAARFIEKRDDASLAALCFSAMLLTQVRYESAIFLLPVAAVILWVWYREGRAILPPILLAIPPLMIHCALHNRIFDIRSSAWQMESKPGFTKPFSASYIPSNVAHALGFFFGKPTDQPNSYVLSALGCVALLFFLLLAAKRSRALAAETPASAALIFFSIGFAIQLGLMMCYFWGQFDDAIIRRLSLPTHLWMVLAIMAVLTEFPRPAFVRCLLGVAVLGMLAQGVPSMAAHAYNQEYLAGLETEWRRQFILDQPFNDYLAIDNDSILWVAHRVTATTVEAAKARKADLSFFIRTHTFSNIYVFQRYNVDAQTGKMTIREGDDLGPDFVLEPVQSERLLTLTQTRISRVVSIRDGKTVTAMPPPDVVVPKDRALIEKERGVYLENFYKRLP
ncbi:MAG TPA: glycosyltransferase family 39 protein [Opitutaceae bacterium]